MMYRTHLAFALFCGLVFFKLVNPVHIGLYFGLVLFGGLLPDIDEHNSKLGRKIRPLSTFLNLVFGHRNLFHSLFFTLALFGIVNYFYGLEIALALVIGYASHLVIDGFTIAGINYLYPFSRLHLKGPIHTGGLKEHFVYLLLIGLCVFKLISLL